MQWIAPSEENFATDTFEKRRWETADQPGANSGLTAQQYFHPVVGLNYLWIQLFYFALNEKRRAGFEMTDSASDADVSKAHSKSCGAI
jgi:hypothetical protein